jgi:hypothetical protein
MKNAKYYMMYIKPNILTNSKLKFGIIFVLTTTLMIAMFLVGGGFSNSIFAFSNKYSTHEHYDSGVRDGNKDCQNGLDTSAYKQSGAYLWHSKYYQQGYEDTVASCDSDGDNIPGLQYTSYDNYNQKYREQAPSQGTTQKPLYITVFGSCNTTSGEVTGLAN